MKDFLLKNRYRSLLGVLCFGLLSCQNEAWDDHYEDYPQMRDMKTVDWLASKGEYSKFLSLLESTGITGELRKGQSFTVWAVKNEAMTDLSAYSKEEQKAIAQNHLNYGTVYLSKLQRDTLRTLNGKLLEIKKEGGGFLFQDEKVKAYDRALLDGVVHEVARLAMPRKNIREYFDANAPEFAKMLALLEKEQYREADLENSKVLKVNEQGKTVYDTVWVDKNHFYEELGDLVSEDDRFAALLPTDAFVGASFAATLDFYLGEDHGLSDEELAAKKEKFEQELMKNWLLKEFSYASPSEMPEEIEGISGRLFFSESLKNSAEKVVFSNGVAFKASHVVMKCFDIMAPGVDIPQLGLWYEQGNVTGKEGMEFSVNDIKGKGIKALKVTAPAVGDAQYIDVALSDALLPGGTYVFETFGHDVKKSAKVKISLGDAEFMYEGVSKQWEKFTKEVAVNAPVNSMRITFVKKGPENPLILINHKSFKLTPKR